MKKTWKKNLQIAFVCSFISGLLFFNAGCGLDTYEVIDAPEQVYNAPVYDSTYDRRYFEFRTYETNISNYSSITFLGTDVYYKIYNNHETAESEANSLVSTSNNTETSANAASRLMETYSYQQIKVAGNSSSVLIPENGTNQRVYIRLTSYQNDPDLAARITVDGNLLNGANSAPLRFEDNLNFDFGRSDKNAKSKVPVSNDKDVKYSSTTSEEGKWYVNLFAVAVGRDVTYTNNYSNILYLGTVCIDEKEYDN